MLVLLLLLLCVLASKRRTNQKDDTYKSADIGTYARKYNANDDKGTNVGTDVETGTDGQSQRDMGIQTLTKHRLKERWH